MTFISINASVSVFVTIPSPHGGQAWFQEKMSRGRLFKRAGGELQRLISGYAVGDVIFGVPVSPDVEDLL